MGPPQLYSWGRCYSWCVKILKRLDVVHLRLYYGFKAVTDVKIVAQTVGSNRPMLEPVPQCSVKNATKPEPAVWNTTLATTWAWGHLTPAEAGAHRCPHFENGDTAVAMATMVALKEHEIHD